jgi:hypothetical protein
MATFPKGWLQFWNLYTLTFVSDQNFPVLLEHKKCAGIVGRTRTLYMVTHQNA